MAINEKSKLPNGISALVVSGGQVEISGLRNAPSVMLEQGEYQTLLEALCDLQGKTQRVRFEVYSLTDGIETMWVSEAQGNHTRQTVASTLQELITLMDNSPEYEPLAVALIASMALYDQRVTDAQAAAEAMASGKPVKLPVP